MAKRRHDFFAAPGIVARADDEVWVFASATSKEDVDLRMMGPSGHIVIG